MSLLKALRNFFCCNWGSTTESSEYEPFIPNKNASINQQDTLQQQEYQSITIKSDAYSQIQTMIGKTPPKDICQTPQQQDEESLDYNITPKKLDGSVASSVCSTPDYKQPLDYPNSSANSSTASSPSSTGVPDYNLTSDSDSDNEVNVLAYHTRRPSL